MIFTLSEIKIIGEYLAASAWMSMCYKHKSVKDNFSAKGVGEKNLILKGYIEDGLATCWSILGPL